MGLALAGAVSDLGEYVGCEPCAEIQAKEEQAKEEYDRRGRLGLSQTGEKEKEDDVCERYKEKTRLLEALATHAAVDDEAQGEKNGGKSQAIYEEGDDGVEEEHFLPPV
jgi:hypothetical protein